MISICYDNVLESYYYNLFMIPYKKKMMLWKYVEIDVNSKEIDVQSHKSSTIKPRLINILSVTILLLSA